MNTEKSIKLMNVIKSILPEHYNFDFGKPEIDEIIKRLQMWENFKKALGSRYIHYSNINFQKTISEAMEEFEKECFPKEDDKSTGYKECMEAIKKLSEKEGYKLLLEMAVERLEKGGLNE